MPKRRPQPESESEESEEDEEALEPVQEPAVTPNGRRDASSTSPSVAGSGGQRVRAGRNKIAVLRRPDARADPLPEHIPEEPVEAVRERFKIHAQKKRAKKGNNTASQYQIARAKWWPAFVEYAGWDAVDAMKWLDDSNNIRRGIIQNVRCAANDARESSAARARACAAAPFRTTRASAPAANLSV